VQSVVLTTTDLFASREGHRVGTQVVLQATPNHPVWTPTGAVPLGKLQTGATVQCLAAGADAFTAFRVTAANRECNATTGSYYTDKVYNLGDRKPQRVRSKRDQVCNGEIKFQNTSNITQQGRPKQKPAVVCCGFFWVIFIWGSDVRSGWCFRQPGGRCTGFRP
jgi:hypothetical protein